ncbi:gluconokinase [Microbacterium sp. BK668]|uniref:gluconokinase n=1 Tax=Microbacterium sp. BK668 TaxID=2512118 RepID=UPI0010604D6A|nr:gluconokinase [Microbacterium sp. BK668]TDN91725.1 gluconate kinase (SKI family) [Microbacterium sp. BK668]
MSLVVMGVSGSGKSTVAALVAERAGATFIDADDLHPRSNVDKMAAGIPLTDEDRMPWLREVGDVIARHAGERVVVACSALKRAYRDAIRERAGRVLFAQLDGARDLLAERMGGRGHHFMPLTLLDSQLATLEPLEDDEHGLRVDIARSPDAIADAILARWLAQP